MRVVVRQKVSEGTLAAPADNWRSAGGGPPRKGSPPTLCNVHPHLFCISRPDSASVVQNSNSTCHILPERCVITVQCSLPAFCERPGGAGGGSGVVHMWRGGRGQRALGTSSFNSDSPASHLKSKSSFSEIFTVHHLICHLP